MRALLPGHGASRGSALGRARVRLPHVLDVAEQHIRQDQIDDELARLHEAVDATRREMHSLRARLHGALAKEVGGDAEAVRQALESLCARGTVVKRRGRYLLAKPDGEKK